MKIIYNVWSGFMRNQILILCFLLGFFFEPEVFGTSHKLLKLYLIFIFCYLQDANSTEVGDCEHELVIDMPEHNPGEMGGTMRLGKRTTLFKEGKSIISTAHTM